MTTDVPAAARGEDQNTTKAPAGRVRPSQTIHDVLIRCPATGPILLQHGLLSRNGTDPPPAWSAVPQRDRSSSSMVCCPATGPILLQHGLLFSVKPGELHVRDDETTVESYAAINQLALDSLLRLLNAAADDDDRRPPSGQEAYGTGPVVGGALGYTGAYREPSPDLELASVVEVQAARGPE